MYNYFTNALTNGNGCSGNNGSSAFITTQNGNGTWLYGGTYQASVYVRLTDANNGSNGYSTCSCNRCCNSCRRCCWNSCWRSGCGCNASTFGVNGTNASSSGCYARQYGYNRNSCGCGCHNND